MFQSIEGFTRLELFCIILHLIISCSSERSFEQHFISVQLTQPASFGYSIICVTNNLIGLPLKRSLAYVFRLNGVAQTLPFHFGVMSVRSRELVKTQTRNAHLQKKTPP